MSSCQPSGSREPSLKKSLTRNVRGPGINGSMAGNLRTAWVRIAWVLCLTGCSGQLVAIKLPKQDANPNAYYVCTPKDGGTTFDCKSERVFHQYDRELVVSEQQCDYGVANVYVETNWRGNVTRIQYVCSTAPVGEFPDK
jgi:hypothetical protein